MPVTSISKRVRPNGSTARVGAKVIREKDQVILRVTNTWLVLNVQPSVTIPRNAKGVDRL